MRFWEKGLETKPGGEIALTVEPGREAAMELGSGEYAFRIDCA